MLLSFYSLLVVATFAGIGHAAPAKSSRPNIVVILADDQGWGDLSVHGNTNLHTPRIDSLARDGALFERFFVCPVCSPTRAEFLTGRYHPRGNVSSTSTGGERLDLDERTIGDFFTAAGYRVGAFGKWHSGTQWPYHPNARGFGEYYGFCSGHWGDYFSPPLEHNGDLVRGKGFIIDDLTDHAMAFIEANRGGPFFCYAPFNTPHSPMQVPDPYWDRFRSAEVKLRATDPKSEDLDTTRAALAMCENIDWNVGRILDKLDGLGLSDNTIVLYFSDNGPNTARFNGGMKGRKGSTDEGGVRSPLLIRWPGKIRPESRVRTIAGAIDLLPTLAELADVPLGPGPSASGQAGQPKPLDGISQASLLLGKTQEAADRMIFSHWAGKVSVRTNRHRLDTAGKLYDMHADPGQTRDISKEDSQTAERLSQAVRQWRRDVLSELSPDDGRPFTVGYRAFPKTWLPARDGVASGHIRRSDKAPNCSFFTGWTSVDDRITWDVDIATAGRYEAIVYYTCAKANVGARIELACGPDKVNAVVTEAFDPPLYGAEHDRVPRKHESLMKDFKPLRLGEIDLKPGRRPLVLRALDIPGPATIDVRAVLLKRGRE